MTSLAHLQQERDERTRTVLSNEDASIAADVIGTASADNLKPSLSSSVENNRSSIILIQCAVRILLAKKHAELAFSTKFHQEEEERRTRAERQVTEGLALVDQAKLTQEMADQEVLERTQSMKEENTKIALQLHSQTTTPQATTTTMQDEFGVVADALDDLLLEDDSDDDTDDSDDADDKNGTNTSTADGYESKEVQVVKVGVRKERNKGRKTASSTSGGQKRGHVVQTVMYNGRELAVKEDSEDGEDGSGEMSNSEIEDSDEGASSSPENSRKGGSNSKSNSSAAGTGPQQKGGNTIGEISPAQIWLRRVQEFQCDESELRQLRRVDLESRVRDLEVLLSQLSESVTEALTENSELHSKTEFLDITISQLMERISPGHINIKTGAHKKGRTFPQRNTTRKHFDKF